MGLVPSANPIHTSLTSHTLNIWYAPSHISNTLSSYPIAKRHRPPFVSKGIPNRFGFPVLSGCMRDVKDNTPFSMSSIVSTTSPHSNGFSIVMSAGHSRCSLVYGNIFII